MGENDVEEGTANGKGEGEGGNGERENGQWESVRAKERRLGERQMGENDVEEGTANGRE